MPTQRKIQQVAELKDRLDRCSIVIATDPSGVNVNIMNDLRRMLRERNIEYRVVKNNLAYIAAGESKITELKDVVQGPTGLAFGYTDPIEVARALEEFIRTSRSSLSIRGGLLEHRVLDTQEVSTLAALPPKEVLLAQLLGQVQAPIARFVGQLQAPVVRLITVLEGPLGSLTVVLQQRVNQLEQSDQDSL